MQEEKDFVYGMTWHYFNLRKFSLPETHEREGEREGEQETWERDERKKISKKQSRKKKKKENKVIFHIFSIVKDSFHCLASIFPKKIFRQTIFPPHSPKQITICEWLVNDSSFIKRQTMEIDWKFFYDENRFWNFYFHPEKKWEKLPTNFINGSLNITLIACNL